MDGESPQTLAGFFYIVLAYPGDFVNSSRAHSAGWNFDTTYSRLPQIFYARVAPTPVRSPAPVVMNQDLGVALGLDAEALLQPETISVLAGNQVPAGATPLAQAYAGHQFGYFTRLGDGRAILLGEQVTPGGERFDVQLKGCGKTPYSRNGDGRAALGPMLREYVISQAMHALGIPTTRSLAVVSTGEPVFRETALAGAVLCRVADSHVRVGTFEYAAAFGTREDVRALADYAIARHFPELAAAAEDIRYWEFLQAVVCRQAALIAQWQQVGFIHGVMNTDNMAISGQTIDYGPCAFMDRYDPATVFSSIDQHGRYAYGQQPRIAQWNLARFAETLLPLLSADGSLALSRARAAVAAFSSRYQQCYLAGMRRKLGIDNEEPGDAVLIADLLTLMEKYGVDFTNTFRDLGLDPERAELPLSAEFSTWRQCWQQRLRRQSLPAAAARQRMDQVNPWVIPRNHRVEAALTAATEHADYQALHELLAVLAEPYAATRQSAAYRPAPPPTNPPYRTFCGT